MLFYDFEVFKNDWLVVIIDAESKHETVIVNDADRLREFFEGHERDIWIGFNNKNYDQWILKGIITGFNPKKINDYIIEKGNPGYTFSDVLRKINVINYDVFNPGIDKSLKTYEGFMGSNIHESAIPFDIDRPLTDEEIQETIAYCRHDVEETIKIFMLRYDDFNAQLGLLKYKSQIEDRPINLSLLAKTKAQLSAQILKAHPNTYNDEFDIDFPSTLKIEKYQEVVEWYRNPKNLTYVDDAGKKNQLEIDIAGVPHVFGWGGLHGAIPKYSGEGYFVNMDVASLYPSLMIEYNLHSRSIEDSSRYVDIYHTRLQYKKEKNPLQQPLKIVLNSTYGAMKDKFNALYDPRQANRVCVYGQLLLLDLIEKLEPYCEIIQSNTDGVLVKLRHERDFDLIDDIAYEWETRTRLQLEFDCYKKVYQKDVNNYVIVDFDNQYKSKGAYVKKLNALDYELYIVNKALIDYMVHDIPIEITIQRAQSLRDFQMIARATSKYKGLVYGDQLLQEKTARIFAAKAGKGKPIYKVSKRTNNPVKVANSPLECIIVNDTMNDKGIPEWLDLSFYVDMAKERLKAFRG